MANQQNDKGSKWGEEQGKAGHWQHGSATLMTDPQVGEGLKYQTRGGQSYP